MRKNIEVQRQIAAQCVLNIRSGRGGSRKELATLMSMSPSTAGFYVDRLIEAGFVKETGLEKGSIGRPRRCLEVCQEAGWFAGVEWNADQMQAVKLNFSGVRIATVERSLQRGMTAEDVIGEIIHAVGELPMEADGPFLGIGLGAPGVVDPEKGTAGDYSFITNWKEVPLRARLEGNFSVPVTVESNLRVIAMAERWFGAAGKLEDFIILGPRSGVGVAVMHRGGILGGFNHAAGELGNWWWNGPGSGGELHHVLSAPAVWRRLTGASESAPLPKNLRGAMEDIAAQRGSGLQEVARDFAQLIGSLHLLLDTEAIFVHGPLCGLGQAFWEKMVVKQAQVLMPRLVTRPPVVRCSKLKGDAGALGAASLAMEAWTPDV